MMEKDNNNIKKTYLSIFNALKQPLLATIFGLLIGAVVITLAKGNPIKIYIEMFNKSFFQPYYLMQSLSRATPIIICAIATAAAWRAGYINIGVEGQMIVGGFVSTVCAIYIPGPPILIMILSIIIGMVAGALYATIAAVLNIKYNVSIIISTLMMNYIADYITSYFVSFPLKDTTGDGISLQTVQIDAGMRFLRFGSRSTLNMGFIIAIVIVLLFLFMTRKTVFGYESKMTGLNPFFAKYGGVKQNAVMLKTMALSGAIASLAGTIEVFGVKYRFVDGLLRSTSYAWTGLMASLIAALNPIGIFFSSIFLAGLQVGGQSIQRTSNIPLEMSTLIQSCITLFVSVKLTTNFINKRKSLKSRLSDKEIKGGE